MDKSEQNKIRYKRLVEEGRCTVCGEPTDGYVLCDRHRAMSKKNTQKWRDKVKKQGLCLNCGRKSRKGKLYCEKCNQERAEAKTEESRFLRTKKICPQCRKNPTGGSYYCEECQDKFREYARRYREKNRELIREREKTKRILAKEQGLCQRCGKRPQSNGTYCSYCYSQRKCLEAKHREGTIPRIERVSYGLCYVCGEPIDRDGRSCSKCADRYRNMIRQVRPKGNKTWEKDNAIVFRN